MRKKTVTQEILAEKCPYCKKEITGTKESQVKYNLKLHIEAKHADHDYKKIKKM